jgi:hypothetical protein
MVFVVLLVFLRGVLEKVARRGRVFVVSCGGMCGKRGPETAVLWRSKNRTGFSALFGDGDGWNVLTGDK